MLKPITVILCLAASAGFLPGFARAADSPSSEAPARADTAVYSDPGVEVKARRVLTTSGGASAVTVGIDTAFARPDPTLEQILRRMPLVQIRTNSRGEAQPSLRGAEDRQIAILVDGVPITAGWDHRADLSVVPLSGARSVTLYRGLPSVLLGPNVLGGAVEVDVARGRRRDPRPPPLSLEAGVDQTGARSMALTGGMLRESGGAQWLARAGAGYRGQGGVALPGALRESDPFSAARLTEDGELRLNSDIEAVNGFFALRRLREGGGWTSLSASGYRLERGVPPESHASEPRLWRYPLQARVVTALSAGSGFFTTPWGRGDVEASVGIDVGRTRIDSYDALDYANVVASEEDDDRTWTLRLIGDHGLGARGSLRAALTYADIRHDEILVPDGPASYRQRLWSLAGETEWRYAVGPGGGTPLRVSLGAAADGADTPVTADKPPLGRLWDWGARLGASAAFADGRLVAHGAIHRRTRFPSLRELYSGALGRFVPNPALAPEALLGAEAGVTLAGESGAAARSELQLVGFHHRLEDGIARVLKSTPQGNKFQRVNQGEILSTGVEVLGQIPLGRATLGADATVQRTHGVDGLGNEVQLEYEPRVSGGLRLDAPLPGRLRAEVLMRGVTRQSCIHPDLGTLESLPPSAQMGLGLIRSFSLASSGFFSELDASLSVDNLGDVVAYDQCGLPQPGRTIRVAVRMR